MKRIIIFLLAILPMAYVLSTAEAKPNKQKVVLYVHLHCEDCCQKILKNIPFDKDLKNGVKDLVFDLEAQTVTVTYDANKTMCLRCKKHSLRLANLRLRTSPNTRTTRNISTSITDISIKEKEATLPLFFGVIRLGNGQVILCGEEQGIIGVDMP